MFGTKTGNKQNQGPSPHGLRLFTPRQPIPDVQTTSQEWKPDPDVIVKHDDLDAGAWESEYETPIFNNGQRELDSDNSPETRVRHGLP